jgi:dynein heavy chain
MNYNAHRYHRMPSIFQEHRNIIANKTGEYQHSLKIRIEKFQEDLEIYTRHCDEMQWWGNVDEIFRYKKKADRLNSRLVDAIQTIDEFNIEEQLFGWELSQYPLRKKVYKIYS